MVESERGKDNRDASKDAGDILLALMGALIDVFSRGSTLVESILAQRAGGGQSFPPRPSSSTADVGTSDDQPSEAGIDPSVAAALAQAYFVAIGSGLRYWQRVANTYNANRSEILRSFARKAADSDLSEEERRTLIDELRAYLRELGELSLQEARTLNSEMEKVAAQIGAPGTGEDDPRRERRRWKVKP